MYVTVVDVAKCTQADSGSRVQSTINTLRAAQMRLAGNVLGPVP